jgi:hypothetical protein
MDKAEFKNILVSSFPAFEEWWDDEDINREQNGSYTAHGLLSSFFFFYKERYMNYVESDIREFADKIETIVAEDSNDESDVANAICTSYLELLNKNKEGKVLEKYLGSECRKFLNIMRGENDS